MTGAGRKTIDPTILNAHSLTIKHRIVLNYTHRSAGGFVGDCQAPLKHFSQTISSVNYDINIINFNLNIISIFNRNPNRKTNRNININFNINSIINFIEYSTDVGYDSYVNNVAELIIDNTNDNLIDNDTGDNVSSQYHLY